MALFTWTDALSVNIKEIDTQHQKLFELMNKLHEAMKIGKGNDVLGGILGDLVKYTVVHFSNEETYLKKYDYPEYVQHKKIHDDLTQKARPSKPVSNRESRRSRSMCSPFSKTGSTITSSKPTNDTVPS